MATNNFRKTRPNSHISVIFGSGHQEKSPGLRLQAEHVPHLAGGYLVVFFFFLPGKHFHTSVP